VTRLAWDKFDSDEEEVMIVEFDFEYLFIFIDNLVSVFRTGWQHETAFAV
jgi:hypothetical protein